MARDPDAGGTGQVPRPNAEAAEAFLRRLADTELRWVLAQPDPPPGPSRGRPPLAPAARAVNRVRAAAGALISAGVIDEAAAMSVLAGRWHVGRQTNAPIGGIDGHGLTDIALIPPLHPAATSLDIVLPGPTGQARAATPLHWQPLR